MSLTRRQGINGRGKAALVATTALLLATVGCGGESGGDSESAGGWESDLISEGELIIGTSANLPPYTMQEAGTADGYSVAQCKELADRMGLEPRIEILEFSGVMTGVQSGKIDIVCSGELSQTDERKQATGFYLSTPTLYESTGLMTTADNKDPSDFEDARGAKVGGVQGGAPPNILKKELADDVEIVLFPGVAEAIQGLKQGRVEYLVNSSLVLSYYEKNDPDLRIVATGLQPLSGGLIISRNEALRDKVNEVSQEMLEDGTIEELQKEFFGATALPPGSD